MVQGAGEIDSLTYRAWLQGKHCIALSTKAKGIPICFLLYDYLTHGTVLRGAWLASQGNYS